MWTWADRQNNAAIYVATGEPSIFCGINVDPLATWLAEGNEPEPYVEVKSTEEEDN